MRFFHIPNESSQTAWHATLTDAHKFLRDTDPIYRADYEIVEVEVDTAKAGILTLLRDEGAQASPTGRHWKVTARGGLREIP